MKPTTTKRYTIGIDYGSLSGRGVLVDVSDGSILAESVMNYPHGDLQTMPDGTPLKSEWVLQDPNDYTAVLYSVVKSLLTQSGVCKEQIVGIGIDATSSTPLPLDGNFEPLCNNPKFRNRPHAWLKLWKHHAARPQAEQLAQICREQGRPYPDWYGGMISQECMLAKVVQVFQEDREVFDAADCFVEVGDYLVSLLAGKPVFSANSAAAKAFWDPELGYPDSDFFAAIDPELADLPRKKLMEHFPDRLVLSAGMPGAKMCPEMAEKLGLMPGIGVSAFQMDAYAGMPGLGVCEAGTMLMVAGTSTAILLLSENAPIVEGVTARLKNTYYPGFWGYASGQASVGDGFQWFVDNCVPESYAAAAREKGMSLHSYLTELAAPLRPGQTGLLALDWFNGNKSVLMTSRLSGMFLGLTLKTRPEHIYRAMLEATAFGARKIVEAYEGQNVPVNSIVVCGGIAVKNPFMMQMYADVLKKPLAVSLCTQGPALGAAILGASAAGEGDIFEATRRMCNRESKMYQPNPENIDAYEALYQEYSRLHDYFGRGENAVMDRLKRQCE